MIELRYVDSYQQERSVTYENMEAFRLSLAGCVTIPDHFNVTALLCDGKNLHYQGTIGQLYHFLQSID